MCTWRKSILCAGTNWMEWHKGGEEGVKTGGGKGATGESFDEGIITSYLGSKITSNSVVQANSSNNSQTDPLEQNPIFGVSWNKLIADKSPMESETEPLLYIYSPAGGVFGPHQRAGWVEWNATRIVLIQCSQSQKKLSGRKSPPKLTWKRNRIL